MDRRIKLHFKTGAVILAFSLLVTAVFACALLWYGTAEPATTEKGDVYPLLLPDYTQLVESGGNLRMDAGRLVGVADYQTALLNKHLQRLTPVSLVFLTALFLLSLCLWSILKWMQKKQSVLIAGQLNDVMTDHVTSDDPVLASAYGSLQQTFENQLNDYKRLSAYLAHEQKNEVAILRTRLELSENLEHLKTLDNIAHSIDDILTLSETADTSPLVPVDVSVVCAEVYDQYRKVAQGISFDYEGQEDTEILARSRWIHRAVSNLLDNAMKYGEGKPILLSVRAKHGSVIVSVQDHGIGIEEAKQERIFNDRYRVNELNKDGYGIGLSLVSHVCDLCGGYVAVESEPGQGATFYLSFPQKLF